MTKSHSRLLVTLVLAAVYLTAFGVGTGHARSQPLGAASPVASSPRPGIGPYSGEPDTGGQSAPTPKVNPTFLVPGIYSWMPQLWIHWSWRAPKETGRRRF
jgi:hypothetical protein